MFSVTKVMGLKKVIKEKLLSNERYIVLGELNGPLLWRCLKLAYIVRLSHNEVLKEKVKHYNDFFFKELCVDRESAHKLCLDICSRVGIDEDEDGNDSIHYLAFAALSYCGFRPKNILELGTAYAESTVFLAELFPDAKIYTIDLPSKDPLYQIHYQGDSSSLIKARNDRLEKPNIVSFRINTAFLRDLNLPEMDLIWLDAAHTYPAVAWDHFYCISKLAPSGWLFSDDIAFPDKSFQKTEISHTYSVVDYFNKRLKNQFRYLLKRENLLRYIVEQVDHSIGNKVKYIAFFHKSA
jgi:hypothetical protein